ncbi:MmgE/PrpD family protein [Sphingosinicella sp. CPCC 101087]|uniref:MmgE/PrpD family protein n=1 Tax=Sphingosinicella sp. CPCC 101087 TaxID=2497754 RepID=UPI00101DA300|nr:MmgE/PrpD family protein [Sphingosinicella sp. CPCC 101087]
MNLTRILAEHVAGTAYDQLPRATVHATKRALLDSMGVMLAASGLAEEARPYRRLALAQRGRGRARLIGGAASVPVEAAALANGALAHALDYGDTFDAGPAHPNAGLVPALLALAESEGIGGKTFITAMAAGCDLCCRLSLAAVQPLDRRGWYPPPLFGLIGATAGCARLLGLSAEETLHAIGLALCQASFPGEIKHDATSPIRAVREGFVARAAVTAVDLAKNGARSFQAPLEGKSGFFAAYAGAPPDPSPLLDGLGTTFLGERVSFKPWPSCRGTHAYIQAALELRKRPGFDHERISRIEVMVGPVQQMLVTPAATKAAPVTSIDAKFSIPFTLAAALVHGSVGLDSFCAEARNDPVLLACARKVVAIDHPDWDHRHAASGSVRIVADDGAEHQLNVAHAAGHPEEPIGDEALTAKFVDCAARAERPVTGRQAQVMASRIMEAETLAEMGALLDPA